MCDTIHKWIIGVAEGACLSPIFFSMTMICFLAYAMQGSLKNSFYLTPRVLRLNSPQPRRGGEAIDAVTIQMKTIVRRVERGVESGNWRSFVTIINLANKQYTKILIMSIMREVNNKYGLSYLWRARIVREIID